MLARHASCYTNCGPHEYWSLEPPCAVPSILILSYSVLISGHDCRPIYDSLWRANRSLCSAGLSDVEDLSAYVNLRRTACAWERDICHLLSSSSEEKERIARV